MHGCGVPSGSTCPVNFSSRLFHQMGAKPGEGGELVSYQQG